MAKIGDDEPSIGMSIEGVKNLSIDSFTISDADIGVQARDVSKLEIDQLRYDGPGVALDIAGADVAIRDSVARTTGTVSAQAKSYGYVRPKGPALPAQCSECRSIFPSRHYNVAVPFFLTKNHRETCRVCGFYGASLANGVYNLVGEFISVIQADENSLPLIAAIGMAATNFPMKGTQADVEVAIGHIGKASPNAEELLRKKPWFIVTAILAGLSWTLSTANDGYDVFEKYSAGDKALAIYDCLSKLTIEHRSSDEYNIERREQNEKQPVSNMNSDDESQQRSQIDKSSAMPGDIPVPVPRPPRP